MEAREFKVGLETEGRDVDCAYCGLPFVSSQKPSYCCDGKDCGCYGKDQTIHICDNCNEIRTDVYSMLNPNG